VKILGDHTKLLELPTDIFSACYERERHYYKGECRQSKTKVVEGVNGPTAFKADKILYDRGTIVVLDVLDDAGGVTMS